MVRFHQVEVMKMSVIPKLGNYKINVMIHLYFKNKVHWNLSYRCRSIIVYNVYKYKEFHLTNLKIFFPIKLTIKI